MNRIVLAVMLFICTLLTSQANHGESTVAKFDDIQHGMSMRDVADVLRKHGYDVREAPGMLTVHKDGRSVGWVMGGGTLETENVVNSVTTEYEPLDFAVALHNDAQSTGTVVESPSWQHVTTTQMTVRVTDQTEKDGQNQFVDLLPSNGAGMYRIVIRRRNHGDTTVGFEFIR